MRPHPIRNWFNHYLQQPEVFVLMLVLLVAGLGLYFFGAMLTPVLVSVAIAYLLQAPINRLQRWQVPHPMAVAIVYFVFLGALIFAMIGLIPSLWRQLNNLFLQFPLMLSHGQLILRDFYARYPNLISPDLLGQMANSLQTTALTYGQKALSFSLNSISNLMLIGVYFVLVPLLVYFFLMDKTVLLRKFKHYLPRRRRLLTRVWLEVYEQMGRYVRGKVLEAIIVGVAFFIQFIWMGLNYASLMAVLVGLSVIVPYVGAVIVTIPLLVIAILQWGFSSHLGYFVMIYALLIAIDANVLVPLIFAEAVNLHPVSIILAILVFGGLFGFWGVFFAIPLASLVKSVSQALAEAPSLS